MASASLHDIDIMTWADEQAREIRDLARRPNLSNMLDWVNLAEEIESVGRSQVSGVKRKLVLMISHLLKILSAPDSPASKGWRSEIGSFQKLLHEEFSPSMRRLIDWDHIWVSAVEQAQASLSCRRTVRRSGSARKPGKFDSGGLIPGQRSGPISPAANPRSRSRPNPSCRTSGSRLRPCAGSACPSR
jgi:hypothetical protein